MAETIIPTRAIYAIQCEDGRAYVGGSSDLDRRWKEHRAELRRGAHHSRILQEVWHLLGEASFRLVVLELVPEGADLMAAEQRHIDIVRSLGLLLNAMPNATAKGVTRTQDTRAKMSAWQIGKKHSAQTKSRISAANSGRTHSAQSRANMGASKVGLLSGEKHPLSKVTEADVLSIRQMAAEGVRYPDIAAKHGISRPAVSLIVSRRRWAHVPPQAD